jgi:hypothetical protein
LHTIAAEIQHVLPPYDGQQAEAGCKRQETAQHLHELRETLRHLERYDQQRHRKCKYCIRKALETRDLFAAPAEVRFTGYAGPYQVLANHFPFSIADTGLA